MQVISDKRITKTILRFRMDEMMVVSCSFEPGSMMYTNCENRGKHSVLNSYDGGPVVFIGTDQHFPAVLPSLDLGSCISIVRVEDGGLRDIAWNIIDLLSGINLPPRSTILIGSSSSIAAKGIQTYGEDMAWSIRVIREKLGDRVCPASPEKEDQRAAGSPAALTQLALCLRLAPDLKGRKLTTRLNPQ